MKIDKLGEDQWKWLNKYGNINLNEWRLIQLENSCKKQKGIWMYIGNWQPDYEGNRYYERQENLKFNKYYYWPK